MIAPLHVGSVFVPEPQYAMPVMFGQVPNITGWVASVAAGANGNIAESTGCLSAEGTELYCRPGADELRYLNQATIKFAASDSSSIFNGSNVQYPAIQVLPCIRC